MSTAAAPTEIVDPDRPDPPQARPSTRSEPQPGENDAEPDDRRGDVDDLPRAR